MLPYGLVAFLYKVGYVILRVVFFFYYDLHFEGRENIPKGAAIYASNHRSYLDPVMPPMAVRRPFNYMAKEPLFQVPVFGQFIRVMGAFPTANSKNPDYDCMEEADKRLQHGRNLVIFPEGTRHTDGKVGRGKSGMCLLSARTGKPVVPVGLVYDSNNLHFRSKICVRIGTPVYPQDYGLDENSTPHEMHAMKNEIMTQIRTMVEENPPFPILHDEPKHKTTLELAKEEKEAKKRAQAEAAQAAKGAEMPADASTEIEAQAAAEQQPVHEDTSASKEI